MINKHGYVYNLCRLICRVFKEMPVMSFLVFVIPLISGMLTVFIYSAQAKIIDIVVYNMSSKAWMEILRATIMPLSIVVIVSIVQALSGLIEKVYGYRLKERISLIFQNEIINIANSIEYMNFDDEEFCNKMQRAKIVVGDDLIYILSQFTIAINIASSLVSVILLAATTGFYSISIIITLMIIINLIIKMSTELEVRKVNREVTLHGRMGDYLSQTLTKSNSIREMRIYNSTKYFLDIWSSTIKAQHSKRLTARRKEIKVGMITTTIQSATIFIVLTILIKNIYSSPKISIGVIATLFLALIQSGSKILSLTWSLSKIYIS